MKLVALALLATAAYAQEAKPSVPAPSAVPEITRLRLMNQYMKTYEENQQVAPAKDAACAKDPDCTAKVAKFNKSYAELKDLFEQTKKELGLTSAQDLAIDVNAPKVEDQVRVVAAQVQPPAPKGK